MEVAIAGFGGQGVLFAGLVLAHAGTDAGLNVAWIPFYGPEMRGGTAGCTVILSEEEVGSPIVSHPAAVVALNEPSLAKWGPRVRPGGVLVVNTSLAKSSVERADVRVVPIPATEVAAALGSDKVANVVALGALIKATGALPLDVVERAIAETLGPGKERYLTLDCEALRRGAALARARPRWPSERVEPENPS